MSEIETRLRAAMQEQQALVQSLTERCLNLAAEAAVLREKLKEKDAVPADPPSDS